MHLKEVAITNFCSCMDLRLQLTRFNPIIGYNNSGKSNILRALSWALKKYALPTHYFFDPVQPVVVETTIVGVDLALLPPNQQAQLQPFMQNDELKFRRRQDSPGVSATQIRIDVWNPTSGTWASNPTGLDNAIGVLFPEPLYVEAMDDAAVDISRFAAKNTIGLLLKFAIEQIRGNNVAALATITQDLQRLGAHLCGPTRLQELSNLERDATAEISEFFPDLGLHLDIQPPAFDDLIKSATISLSDTQGHQRPFTSFGHGAQRTVQMALIKLLAAHANRIAGQGATTVLLIDEPELYLHPQAIERLRDALDTLSQANFQVVFSTHSPLMLGGSHVLNTAIVVRDANAGTQARTKLATAAATIAAHSHQANVIFSIQHATHLLFSEKVFVVEGKTEMMVLPPLYKVINRRSMSHDKTCLIEASSSSSVWPMMQVLRGVGFAPKSIVDLDFVFRVAPQNDLVSITDSNLVACAEWFAANSEAQGFFIGADRWPVKKCPESGRASSMSVESAFAAMAQAMPGEVSTLVQDMAAQDIWVWDKGSIEIYLGIDKSDSARMSFISALQNTESHAHAAHPNELATLVRWLA